MNDSASALLVLGVLAVLGVVVFWPGPGLYWRVVRLRRFGERVLIEHALKHLHHCEFRSLVATLESLSGALELSRNRTGGLVARLEALGLVRCIGSGWELTTEGRQYALRVIRVHRLWERYLAEQTGVAETEWHEEADRREHSMSPAEVEALAATMGNPRYDPHGAPIPTSSGDIAPLRGEPLTALSAGQLAAITHVEDEPKAIYAQLVAQGLRVGVRMRVIEATAERIRFEADGEEQVLAPVVAANLTVVRLSRTPEAAGPSERLSALKVGEKAQVAGILPACVGPQRQRLLDLGLVPGTVVEAELQSPGGDPTAYRVRGALIALRRDQGDMIQIARHDNGGS